MSCPRCQLVTVTKDGTTQLGGQRFRYYLIWLSTLPPGMQRATISDLTLFR